MTLKKIIINSMLRTSFQMTFTQYEDCRYCTLYNAWKNTHCL